MTDINTADNAKANKAVKEAKEASQKQALEDAQEFRREQIETNMKKMEADAKLRPTPTVEEMQKALAGMNVDEKEPTGAPEQNIYHATTPPYLQIEVGREIEPAVSASAPTEKKAKKQ